MGLIQLEKWLYFKLIILDLFSEFQLERFNLFINDWKLRFNGLIIQIDQYSQSVVDGQMNVIIGVLDVFIENSFIMHFEIYLLF
ncbi:unnamed protein product [Blepharisma stoltei]|uniref:Uncharacterized protein n=1 Tax=Blepharisma stoltei TaxID=1481888 RepID=A0AAU9JAM8_9CILI|nr:unnamed protein product [Blepharisma stoltei]